MTTIDIDAIKWHTGRDDEADDVWGRAQLDLGDYGISLKDYDATAKIDIYRFAYRIDGEPGRRCRIVIITMDWDADVSEGGGMRDCSSVQSVEVQRG